MPSYCEHEADPNPGSHDSSIIRTRKGVKNAVAHTTPRNKRLANSTRNGQKSCANGSSAMKTIRLGNSDLKITPIGFGAWAIGGDWEFGWGVQDDTQSIATIHRALELGVNWIDTAAVYGLGHSEQVVARALREWK